MPHLGTTFFIPIGHSLLSFWDSLPEMGKQTGKAGWENAQEVIL